MFLSWAPKDAIAVLELADGIKLTCSDGHFYVNGEQRKELTLPYDDKNSGEYICNENSGMYVKFRSKSFIRFLFYMYILFIWYTFKYV